MSAERAMGIPWHAEALQRRLQTLRPGLHIEVLAEVDSTNTRLLEQARAGDAQPFLLVAETQTAGRGRQGRRWQSAPGASLTFSLRTTLARADWSGLSLAVGLALADALDPPGEPRRIGLKWPNDLLLSGAAGACTVPAGAAGGATVLTRKLGGILIESLPVAGSRVAVVGIGLNVAPLALADLSQGYACLQELHAGIDAPQALAAIAGPLLEAIAAFDAHGFAPLQARYAARDLLAGRPVSTTLEFAAEGVADGVDADGALWVRAGGVRHRVVGGEVSVRSAGAGDAAGGFGAGTGTGGIDAPTEGGC